MHALYSIETTSSYTDIKGKYHTTTEIIYQPKPIDMLNARYGRIKTEEKATHETKARKGYNPQTAMNLHRTEVEGPEHPSDLWNFYKPYFFSANDREEYLYDVIDTETGFVLTRTFKGNCNAFIDMFIKNGFCFREKKTEIFKIKAGKKERQEEKTVGIYANGKKIIRSLTKLEIVKD